MRPRFLSRRQALALLGATLSSGASATDRQQPDPVKLLVGYDPNGSVDFVARTLAAGFAPGHRYAVAVQNMPGASGTLAAVHVALASATSNTLLMGTPSETGINWAARGKARFDPTKDLTPIALVGTQPLILVAAPRIGVSDPAAFVRYASSKPGLKFATSGKGTPLHLAGELINQRARLQMTHVSLSGAGPIARALEDGQTDFAVLVLSSALPLLKEQKAVAVGLLGERASPLIPQVPLMATDGRFAGISTGIWFGVFGPPKLGLADTTDLSAAFRGVLAIPAVRTALQARGIEMMDDQPFEAFLLREMARFKDISSTLGSAS